MKNTQLIPHQSRALSPAEFYHLQAVPPAVEWFANINNPNTRDAYQTDLKDFMDFTGIGGDDLAGVPAHDAAATEPLLRAVFQEPESVRVVPVPAEPQRAVDVRAVDAFER